MKAEITFEDVARVFSYIARLQEAVKKYYTTRNSVSKVLARSEIEQLMKLVADTLILSATDSREYYTILYLRKNDYLSFLRDVELHALRFADRATLTDIDALTKKSR